MTKVDQFESVFRAAARTVFEYRRPEIETVLVITDLEAEPARALTQRIRGFLAELGNPSYQTVDKNGFHSVIELLELIEQHRPELVCTYRHLHSGAWRWPHALGEHLDVLTQVAASPILVFPHPEHEQALAHTLVNTDVVLAITDHLTGDHRLVSWAARFTQTGGDLFLAHVEDDAVFERYIDAIKKIPQIPSELAEEELRTRLMKDPRDYIDSCREGLGEQSLKIHDVVTVGHRLSEYRQLIEQQKVDLLVMNTKDEDQLAMHGLAYPLAVELRTIPLLLL